MFTIDLLKGAGRPPRSRPSVVAGAALAFAAIGVGAILIGVQYVTLQWEAAVQGKTLACYDRQMSRLADIENMLEKNQQQRKELQPSLREVSQVLSTYSQWSPVLTSLSSSVPDDMIVTELKTKRQSTHIGREQIDYKYSLMIGFVTRSEPVAVERFMQSLRTYLQTRLKVNNIRIISQKRQEIRNRTFQYYVVECSLIP